MLTPWRLLIIAAAVFFLYKLITKDKRRKSDAEDKAEAKARKRKIDAGEMVKDPVCGSYVEVDSSIKVRDGQKVYHFCSYDCREKFLDELENEGREIPQLRDREE